MADQQDLILGEFVRSLDERYRASIPAELATLLAADGRDCVLAKERPGCLSLWSPGAWRAKVDSGVQLLRGKLASGRLDDRMREVQSLGRLLSTRHRDVQLAGRGRLVIPEGFREFLGVEPGGEILIIGAAICIEIWSPPAWIEYLRETITDFPALFDSLTS